MKKLQLTRTLRARTLTLILALATTHAFSQTQFAGWLATFQTYKFNDKLGLYFDGQLRSTDQVKQIHSLLLRPGLNVYFTPNFIGTVGYAYIHQQRSTGGVTGYLPEHRTWEQLMFTHKIPAHHAAHTTTLTHRFRLEQRYIPKFHAENGHLAHDKHVYAGRFRYFARAIIPVLATTKSAQGPTPFTKGFFASLQNEIFVNVGNNSNVNGKFFDQNRAYASFGYRCSKQFDVEMGYMNQYISGTGSNSTNNHIAQVATYVRL